MKITEQRIRQIICDEVTSIVNEIEVENVPRSGDAKKIADQLLKAIKKSQKIPSNFVVNFEGSSDFLALFVYDPEAYDTGDSGFSIEYRYREDSYNVWPTGGRDKTFTDAEDAVEYGVKNSKF